MIIDRAHLCLIGSLCVKFMMIGVKRKHLCTGIILPNLATFSYQCMVTLTFDLLTTKSIGHILNLSGVCLCSVMMICVKGRHLCNWNILPNQASTDGWTDLVNPVYIPNFVAGGIKILAAFWGMHVSPAKHSFEKCDRRTDRQSDGRTDGQTDRQRTKWSLLVAMLRRRHKNHTSWVAKIAPVDWNNPQPILLCTWTLLSQWWICFTSNFANALQML